MLHQLEKVLPFLLFLHTVTLNLIVVVVHQTEGPLSTVIDDRHITGNTLKLGVLRDCPPQTAGQVIESDEPPSGLDATELEEQSGLLGDEAADGWRSIPSPANGGEHWLASLELFLHLDLGEDGESNFLSFFLLQPLVTEC